MLRDGFYTALGTPTDKDGRFLASSFIRQVEAQIEANAAGLLVLGSMGIQPCIRNEECLSIAEAAVDAAGGKCAVFVGTMDNSVGRVMDRIWMLEGVKLDGVVVTTPFYFFTSEADLVYYFNRIADQSPFPVYMYDLPTVTKNKITLSIIDQLAGHENIKGIKTADAELCGTTIGSYPDFQVLFSGLDTMTDAHKSGLRKGLDGMFSMAPEFTCRMFKAMADEDYETGNRLQSTIIDLRADFIKISVLRGYSHAMNLLGYEGQWHPDYAPPLTDEEKAYVSDSMRKHGFM